MSKVKMLLRAVGKYTVGYVACHWKEFLTGLLGGIAAGTVAGCSGMSQSDHEVATSVWAIGIPGVAIMKQTSIAPQNVSDRDNTAGQSNPVTVAPSLK